MAELEVLEGIHVEESLLPGSPEEEFLFPVARHYDGPWAVGGGKWERPNGCCPNNDSLIAVSIGRANSDEGEGE